MLKQCPQQRTIFWICLTDFQILVIDKRSKIRLMNFLLISILENVTEWRDPILSNKLWLLEDSNVESKCSSEPGVRSSEQHFKFCPISVNFSLGELFLQSSTQCLSVFCRVEKEKGEMLSNVLASIALILKVTSLWFGKEMRLLLECTPLGRAEHSLENCWWSERYDWKMKGSFFSSLISHYPNFKI